MTERMLLYTRVATPKVPKTRSRAGCTFCKEKKKKCDETRPSCSRCSERGLDCSYEAVRPRQRRKRNSNASASASSIAGFCDRRSSLASTRRWSQASIMTDHHDWMFHVHSETGADGPFFSPLDTSFDASLAPHITNLSCTLSPSTTILDYDLAVDFDEDEEDFGATLERSTEAPSSGNQAVVAPTTHHHVSRPPPDLAMLAPCPMGSPLRDFHMPAFAEISDRRNRRALVAHFCDQLSHLIVFREETGNPFTELVLPLTYNSQPVENAIYALASAHLEYRGVKNMEVSVHFHSMAVQGLASVIHGHEKKAADRNELLAAIMLLVYYEVLVQKGSSNLVNGHLRGAMEIMNSFPAATDPTGMFLERAFRFYDVIAALSFGTAPLSQAPGRSCVQPLPPTGAPVPSRLSSVDTLLGMSTTLWPIIHRLAKLSADKRDLEAVYNNSNNNSSNNNSQASSACMKAVLKSEFETNSRAIERELESWQPPILPADFHPSSVSYYDAASSPETDDDGGEPGAITPPAAAAEDSTSIAATAASAEDSSTTTAAVEKARLHSIFNNAMAYRHSCFVYLYRCIRGHERRHPAVQRHAHTALWHCLQTCSHAGPMGALLWPLFVAACEAVTEEDRGLARRAFEMVERRQGMINIKWAWDIVQEVWRLADLEEEEEGKGGGGEWVGTAAVCGGDFVTMDVSTPHLWRRVSEQMGINIVFG